MKSEIIKRYKRWFKSKMIMAILAFIVLIGFTTGGVSGAIDSLIKMVIVSIIFPPLTIVLDDIMND